jgi:hypothetical protein
VADPKVAKSLREAAHAEGLRVNFCSSAEGARTLFARDPPSLAIIDLNIAHLRDLSRPGGNATGFMQFEYNLSGKWLELLKQIAPSVNRAANLQLSTSWAGRLLHLLGLERT